MSASHIRIVVDSHTDYRIVDKLRDIQPFDRHEERTPLL